jgi:hypothetical protein
MLTMLRLCHITRHRASVVAVALASRVPRYDRDEEGAERGLSLMTTMNLSLPYTFKMSPPSRTVKQQTGAKMKQMYIFPQNLKAESRDPPFRGSPSLFGNPESSSD